MSTVSATISRDHRDDFSSASVSVDSSHPRPIRGLLAAGFLFLAACADAAESLVVAVGASEGDPDEGGPLPCGDGARPVPPPMARGNIEAALALALAEDGHHEILPPSGTPIEATTEAIDALWRCGFPVRDGSHGPDDADPVAVLYRPPSSVCAHVLAEAFSRASDALDVALAAPTPQAVAAFEASLAADGYGPEPLLG